MTAYVTLEPCNHRGRTPACTDALIAAEITRVVVATLDPNNAVTGGGVQRLREAGIQVDSGLMAAEAEMINAGFISRMRRGRPWVRTKCAVSLDGRSALKNGRSKWISSEASRRDVQHWRARSSAIMTGIGTVLADNPSMDARVAKPVLQPTKVIVDSHWRTPPKSRILAGPAAVIIAGLDSRPLPAELESSSAHCLRLPGKAGRVDLNALLNALGEREINEVQVEAGAVLCGGLLEAGLVDEILVYQAPVLLGDGGPGPFAFGPLESMDERTHLKVLETTRFGPDLRVRLQIENRN